MSQFVPFSTIDRLGFNGFHHARATFYRRAKALFHVDSYRDALSSAQGALLLTHYVSSSDPKVNTYWLSNAIYLARLVNVHRHDSLNKTSVQRWGQLERLWCCCLLRDRLLGLGLHRSMQIDAEDALLSGIEDRVLRTKAEESIVHNSTTKLALTKSFSALCSLAALLRRTLGTLSLGPAYSGHGEMKMTTDEIQAYSDLLEQWFTSAKVALWNHAMYNSVKNGCPVHLDFSEGRRAVETAIRGIDASLEQISENGMLSFMPIAIVAHIAIPLVQHIMNIKVHRQQHDASTHKRLSVYIAALNGLKERYEGVDRVLHHIRQIVTCLDGQEMSTSLSSDSRFLSDSPPDHSDGAGSFTYLPRLFLREMIIVQLALAKGQYPEDHELPPPLASPAASDANSTCTCSSNESWNLPELGDAFESLRDAMSPARAPESKQTGNVYGDCGIMTEKPTSPAIAASFDDFHDLFNDG
ncbi:uncharacterized protein Z520_06532 [Fonsecaea multimorphosa CBS 102226]|uniref:Xylanolytic transcriptional activator regulatory domain-containing protein n=1 Tax=Fonsecaea multimorphosa CBS 102226 TaxID=1442371 RepID=A0A0D2K3K1_9EURO|nr:uncharacterized protein Z520_06532 [Fonsecaea multimorphosa CBS 102226]KIX97754.1 hypothetical protein Z520_06532 [Fonsecaea multimorphosa CBS 102226]OAL23774.1 hypothetical protein AYO22_06093 [Fonsecaea multimorphosa]